MEIPNTEIPNTYKDVQLSLKLPAIYHALISLLQQVLQHPAHMTFDVLSKQQEHTILNQYFLMNCL